MESEHRAETNSEGDSYDTPLRELSPSAKLVAKAIELEGESTRAELVDSTLLPKRTVSYALSKLDDAGILTSRPKVTNARKSVYNIDTTELE